MSLADQLLIGWWMGVIVVPIVLLVLFRLYGREEQPDITLALARGVSWQELRYKRSTAASPTIKFFLIVFSVALIFLAISFFAFIIWFDSETRLYVLTSQLFLVAFGVGLLAVSLARNPPGLKGLYPKPGSWGAKILRVLFLAFGSLASGVGSYVLVRDIAFPWRAVEGRIDNIRVGQGGRTARSVYWVVIDGQPRKTTHDVFSGLKVGERVKAEIGSGSNTIFRVQPIPVTPR